MRMRTAHVGLALVLLVTPSSLIACDREDRADVREGVNELDREVDKLDSDGKDD